MQAHERLLVIEDNSCNEYHYLKPSHHVLVTFGIHMIVNKTLRKGFT
jgi:hypothetical protein